MCYWIQNYLNTMIIYLEGLQCSGVCRLVVPVKHPLTIHLTIQNLEGVEKRNSLK